LLGIITIGTNITIINCSTTGYNEYWINSDVEETIFTTSSYVIQKNVSVNSYLDNLSVKLHSVAGGTAKSVRQDIIYVNGTTISQENSTSSETYVTFNFTNPNPDEEVARVEVWGKEINTLGEGYVKDFYIYGHYIDQPLKFELEEDNLDMTIYANDTLGNLNSEYIEWDYKILETSLTYNEEVLDLSLEEFVKIVLSAMQNINEELGL